VVAMFNYFTRVADATGIEFDYPTPLPAFEPDLCRVPTPRPPRPTAGGKSDPVLPRSPALRAAWRSWREYVLNSDRPLTRRARELAAAAAAEESAAWALVAAPPERTAADEPLVTFARQLSREPWSMSSTNLDTLRDQGYSDPEILHLISVVAHQNATVRLHAALDRLDTAPAGGASADGT
jgi:hypothetical protein